ncbi:MAG TPA: methyltransferase [Croceibacterium sp.]|nr:methyltransferase [Croceibacterium sp.]
MDPVRSFGDYFDNPDKLFAWLNGAVFGVAAMNAVNRAGITAALLAGPATIDELAARHGLPAAKLARVIDLLLAHGMLEIDADGVLRATDRTAAMADAAGFLANVETSALAASKLLVGLQQDRIPFEVQFGAPVFEYFGEHPEIAAQFATFMGFMTRRVTRFLFAHHRFAPFGTVVDVGGSMGDLLLAILAEYPGTRGILFDLPEVVAMARARVEAAPLAGRVQLCAGSFFDRVPSADLYVLKQVLHDWDDGDCVRILGTIRAALRPGGRLVVIDHILSDTPEPNEAQGTDIAMLVWANGRERKLAEFEALFAASGWRIARVSRNPSGHSAIEVVAA